MEITKFIVSGRDQALLYGDYGTYRAQLSTRLHSIRKKLGRTTKKGAKYTNKAPVTAEDIASNNEYVHLLLLTSERAWAHAMSMKAAHSADTKGITGSARSHIISRLHKAAKTVEDLLQTLEDQATSKASMADILETRAYATSLTGAEEFEKQKWEACVKSYSIAWVIYSALAKSSKSDVFKDLLSSTIEPSIRYGAYQIRVARTIAVSTIARKYFPRTDTDLMSAISKLDSGILRESSKIKPDSVEAEAASRTITWRSRTVELEDASIAVALAAVSAATKNLSEALSSISAEHLKERAAAYDPVLITSQDAVDATKHAIDELVAEGVGQGDKRVQSLQITRTAVSYDMISWRIGRNRVLSGVKDGALFDSGAIAKPRRSKMAKDNTIEKEEGVGRKLARLREKVVLYDSTLQSLDSIKELPGVAADTAFLKELEAKYNYFRALKCLAIARSHSILSEHKNALALLARASDLGSAALPTLNSLADVSALSLPSISISPLEAQSLHGLLQVELQRHRALVEIFNLTNKSQANENRERGFPLIERLNTYPTNGVVDLTNLVTFPPKLEPIPVKPLFLDVAWNYIDYPRPAASRAPADTVKPSVEAKKQEQEQTTQQQKKGWFAFGR